MIRKNLVKVCVLICLILGVIIAIGIPEVSQYLSSPSKIKQYILGFGLLAPLIFIVLYTLRTLLVIFPVAIFVIISGSLFGVVLGFIYSMIGAFLSASLAFFIGRYLARDTVNKYLTGKIKLLKTRNLKAFKATLYLRLIMIMPYDAFSYAVGATKISYRDFILGTLIGIIPEFIMYVYFGFINLRSDFSIKEKIIFSIIIVSILLLGHITKEIFISKRKKIS